MLEHVTEICAGKRIVVVAFGCQQVEEFFNVVLVNKAFVIGAEEFAEVERHLLRVDVFGQFAEVVSENIHAGQFGVGI